MDNAITVKDVSKVYHIYDNPKDKLKEVLSWSGKKYYREFHALHGVSLDVKRGETLGIIGRNGSGKSTLLKIICGIMKPTSGEIKTLGRISAILELGTGFNPLFTGRENVYLSGALMGFTKEEMDERYPAIESFADIGSFIDQHVRTYSSGMYVRLAFACAVNVDPDILVVDEAISVGDVFFASKCFRKMNEFQEQGKTIIIVSHSTDTIQRNCERTAFLDGGRLLRLGESKDVVNFYLERTLLGGEKAATQAEETAASPKKTKKKDAVAEDIDKLNIPDNCESRPNYNKNEFRYGNLNAYINNYSMTDKEGREVFSVSSGETMSFKFEVVFRELVEQPVYGFAIKTKEGVAVYGINTLFEGIKVKPGKPGDKVIVEFKPTINLVAGDYFITAGVAELSKESALPVDRRYDLVLLHVSPVNKSFGVADLFSKVDVHSGSLSDEKFVREKS